MESKSWEALQAFLGGINLLDALIFCGAIVLLFVGITKIWPVVKNMVSMVDTLQVLPEMKSKLDQVHHEVFPNSGKSLRDELNRNSEVTRQIDAKINGLHRRVEPFTGELQVVKKKIEHTESTLEAHIEEANDVLNEIKEQHGNT